MNAITTSLKARKLRLQAKDFRTEDDTTTQASSVRAEDSVQNSNSRRGSIKQRLAKGHFHFNDFIDDNASCDPPSPRLRENLSDEAADLSADGDVSPLKRFDTPKRRRINSCNRATIEKSVEPASSKTDDYQRKYKTEMCKNFEFRGFCQWGDMCSFAHGAHELRKKIHINLHYRTKLCKQFSENNFCPYGYRCQYLHNAHLYCDQLKAHTEKLLVWMDTNPRLDLPKILNKTYKYSKRLSVFQKLYQAEGPAA